MECVDDLDTFRNPHTKAVKENKASSKGLQLLLFPSFWRCICIKSPDAGFNNVSGFFLLK